MGKIITLSDVFGLSAEEHNMKCLSTWHAVMNAEETRVIFTAGLTSTGQLTLLAVPGADPMTVLQTLKEIVKEWENKTPGKGNLVKLE